MKYNIDNITVNEALDIPEIVKIVEKHFPMATQHPLLFFVKRKTLSEVLNIIKDSADEEKIELIRQEISNLSR